MKTKSYLYVLSCLVAAAGLWTAGGCAAPGVPVPPLASLPAPYPAVAHREFGAADAELTAVETEIHNALPAQYPQFELPLLAIVAAPDATGPGKLFACQMLRIVGSERSVPTLAALLADENLSHPARLALTGIQTPAVDKALLQALPHAHGRVQIGIINTLGDRSSKRALGALTSLAAGTDPDAARAALNAIGRIGGPAAAAALDAVKPAAAVQDAWASAYLRCAGSLAAAGQTGRANKMYHTLFAGSAPAAVRAGALGALVQAEKEQMVPTLVKLLFSEDRIWRQAATAGIVHVPGAAATKALGEALANLDAPGKSLLLAALCARGDAAGMPALLNPLVGQADPSLRLAAIMALGRLGDASSVPLLAAVLKEEGDAAAAASQTLVDLPDISAALAQQAQAGDPAVRTGVLAVLAKRQDAAALPAVRQVTHDADANVRRAALKTLAVLGTPEDVAPLLAMLLAEKDGGLRDQMAETLSAIVRRADDKNTLGAAVLAALAQGDDEAKLRLLNVLSILGGDKALQAARATLAAGSEAHKAAVRVLANWVDAAPLADLRTLAQDDKDAACRIVALRGYIRLVALTNDPAPHKAQAYRQAMVLATRSDESKLVLAGLADVPDLEALQIVSPCLEQKDLQREAWQAYEKIAESVAGPHRDQAREALERVVAQASEQSIKDKAKKALEKIKK